MKIIIDIPDELLPALKSISGNVPKYVQDILINPLLEKYAKIETDVLLSNKIQAKVEKVKNKVKAEEYKEKQIVVVKEK